MSKHRALIATSAILLVGGGAAAIVGGAVLAVFGTDSTISTGHHRVSTNTSALVSEGADFGAHGADVLGHPGIKISVTGSEKPVFVGIGPAAAVDRYLAGASVETVTDFELRPFHLTTTQREGSTRLSPPLDQSFWVSQSAGSTSAATSWKVRDGNYRIVIMNADGSTGVEVDGRFGLRATRLTAISAGVLAGGLGGAVIGVALLVAGLRNKNRPVAGHYATRLDPAAPATAEEPSGPAPAVDVHV
jgi:hypothetical protein